MSIAFLGITFIFGLITGAISIVLLTFYVGKRALDKHKKKKDGQNIESINSRMKKIKEIIAEQLELQSQVIGPQKNAMHGRYKNGLNDKIKELDTEKNDILKSIIKDGFDPEISLMDSSGVITVIKLSEYLAQTGIEMEPVKSTTAATIKLNKFTLIQGGKDDFDDDGGGETTH